MLGEHTEEVISDWLGLNDVAIATLKTDGTVG
jgi:hypothetical protein